MSEILDYFFNYEYILSVCISNEKSVTDDSIRKILTRGNEGRKLRTFNLSLEIGEKYYINKLSEYVVNVYSVNGLKLGATWWFNFKSLDEYRLDKINCILNRSEDSEDNECNS